MPALARGQENTTGIVNWFITVNGVLTDAYAVEFRIFDITGGLPGTQIFPTTPGDYEDVTSGAGNFSTGSYYAYDNANAQGWTPELTASIGTHRIEWRWKISSGSPWQSDSEDVEILVQSAGSSTDTYITVQDVRDAGVAQSDYGDATVLAAIITWQAFLDRACRQWFIPKALTLNVDGNDSDTLFLGVPIISISSLKINGSDDELDPDYYKVYNSRSYPDDRRNPRIKLTRNDESRDIFSMPYQYDILKFRKGRQNQIIVGTFGFTEEDGSVPELIKRALLKLVIEKLTNPVYGNAPSGVTPPALLASVIEEVTDGHKIKYAETTSPGKLGLSGITSDQEILTIIKFYKAPIGLATPSHWSSS